MPNFGALCGSRSLGSCVAEALVPLACPFQRLAPRDCRCLAGGGGEGGPVGGEGEGGPVGGEGEGGRLGLFSSPLPGLFSSPHPGLFSPPPWYSRPDYRSDCRSRRWGDTRARRRYARPGGVGMGGGRAAAAVPPSPALTSPSCFSSNQPVSLRGRRGWECSRAACASARGARSLSRGHGGSGEYLARSHYFTLYQALPLMPLQEPPAAVVEPVRGSSRDLLAPGSELAWRVASLSRSERGRVGACARALLQGEARRGAGRRGAARRAAAARGRSFCPGEAWLARRAVMTQHAEKSLVSHRGGSEPKQATCRMTG